MITAGIGIVMRAGYWWKPTKIADFQGKVQGVQISTETVTINLSLKPGEFFISQGYTVNITHNCYGRVDAIVWLENIPYQAFQYITISGNITNKNTNYTTWYFGKNLMIENLVIPNIPRNATMRFEFYVTAGYPDDNIDLSNMLS